MVVKAVDGVLGRILRVDVVPAHLSRQADLPGLVFIVQGQGLRGQVLVHAAAARFAHRAVGFQVYAAVVAELGADIHAEAALAVQLAVVAQAVLRVPVAVDVDGLIGVHTRQRLVADALGHQVAQDVELAVPGQVVRIAVQP